MAQTSFITEDYVKMPSAFSAKSQQVSLSKDTLIFGGLLCIAIYLVGIGFSVYNIVTGHAGVAIVIFLAALVAAGCVREFLLHERYLLSHYLKLKEKEGVFDSNTVWNCFDVDYVRNVPVYRLSNKQNCVVYQFHRDVVAGKGVHGRALHYDALAEAYRLLNKESGITYKHLDAMSSVGNDPRFNMVRDINLRGIPDHNLERVLEHEYDYLETTMHRSQTSYDYYFFLYPSSMDDDVFFDILSRVLTSFSKANYNSFDSIDETGLVPIMQALVPITDFNAMLAKSKLGSAGFSHNIKVLSTYDSEHELIEELNTFEELERVRVQGNRSSRKKSSIKNFKK